MSQEVISVLGRVKHINLNAGNANYEKSEVVVTTDEQYPQSILIEFGGQKSSIPDRLKIGEQVNISVNLKGREWTNPQGEVKYFNSIQGWKISSVQPTYNAEAINNTQPDSPKNTTSTAPLNNEEPEDLLF